jgi:hypothetical protein
MSVMKQFKSVTEIPQDCIAAPTAYTAPRPGTKPAGSFNGNLFYSRRDVSALLTADQLRQQGRKIKAGAKPLAHRGAEPIGVYADWQTVSAG